MVSLDLAAAALSFAQVPTWDLLIAQGQRATTGGRYSDAVRVYSTALAELGKTADQDLRRLTTLHRLAVARTFQGNYAEAEALYLDVISAAEKFETKPPMLSEALNDLGSLYRQVGRLADAERRIRQAIEIAERRLGAHDSELARLYHNLGMLLSTEQKYGPAERAIKHALSLLASEGTETQLMIAEATSTLADVHFHRKRYRQSADCYARALPTLEELRGPSHPVLVSVLTNLASLHLSAGDKEAAEAVSRRALRISSSTLGETHPLSANASLMVGRVLAARAQTIEAEKYFQDALVVFKQAGPQSVAYAMGLQEFAKFLRTLKRSAEATSVEAKAIAILALAGRP
jgi:tetratricopeptide (TPR) repeat protein